MSTTNLPPRHTHLPRLAPEAYRGFVGVHWIMNVETRATGWLTDLFHARWREALLQALVQHELLEGLQSPGGEVRAVIGAATKASDVFPM